MRFFYRFFIWGVVFLQFFALSGTSNAAPYGTSLYPNGKYGAATAPTQTPSNGGGGGSSGGGSSGNSSGSTCTNFAPPNAPNLFQIDRKGSTATLFFAPSGTPTSGYTIIYGYNPLDRRFSVNFNQSSSIGVVKYTINSLSTKVAYSFLVMGMNGCASGPASGTLTTSGISGSRNYKFYPSKTNLVTGVVSTVKNIKYAITAPRKTTTPRSQTGNVASPLPKTQAPVEQKVQTQSPAKTAPQSTKAQPAPVVQKTSWWQSILNIFN